MDAKEAIEKDFQRQITYNKVKLYHEAGYKGKGITILNAESYPGNDGHGEMTTNVIHAYAPEATVLNSQIKGSGRNRFLVFGNEQYEFEDAIKRFKIKLITSSISVSGDSETLAYYKELQQEYGLIFFCAAGNYADEGIRSKWAKYNTAIAVGAAKLKENGQIELYKYSSTGPELDFVSFLARGRGTSAASPALAAMTALLLQKYGDFNQKECVEILKSLCVDLGDAGRDNSHGYGLPVLPLCERLEILERLRGVEMNFTDVKETDWFKDAVDYCTEQGTLQGFPDGTFKPDEPLTRAQYAQAEYNKAKKEGKI